MKGAPDEFGQRSLRPPTTRDAPGTLLGQTMGLVAVTAALFAVGAYLGQRRCSMRQIAPDLAYRLACASVLPPRQR